jgi:hypothetical protein
MDDDRVGREPDMPWSALARARGACPEVERLTAFVHGELAAEERVALSAHVTLCPSCAGEIDRLESPAAAVDDLSWRRIERRLESRAAPWSEPVRAHLPKGRSLAWWGAAAVVALAAGVALEVGSQRARIAPTPSATTRGGSLQIVEPAGRVETIRRFAWSAPPVAATFRVELFRDEESVFRADTTGTELEAPDDLRRRLVPGATYRWRVVALGSGGRIFLESDWVELRLAP